MTPPFKRVLVAGRGEIAVRICRALRELGTFAVAIYSDVDRAAAHCEAADLALAIGGERATDSYLRQDLILEAARSCGAEAIHPGYGFLSESPGFARAVREAGMCFIGPLPECMERLGSKMSARAVAEKVGVPVVPGWHQDSGDDKKLLQRAKKIGFPLMVKSSSGGGGKGMRLIEEEGQFLEGLAAGRRESEAAFGDSQMLIERLIRPARHVEIQILGDQQGRVVSLHERECSIQRRHQKVIEESPSPALDDALRARMDLAAISLAESVGYQSAGTVEFLLDREGEFYFLEVNTRLQVEHAVTEMVTGLDLVQAQVRIAAGESLKQILVGLSLEPRGHAIEARIYAEQPEQGFLPAAGCLTEVIEARGPGIRVDSGVRKGDEVSVHYDPMLAKLIVHGPDRRSACQRLALALSDSVYLGIPTNVDFLRRIIESDAFRGGDLRTDFFAQHPELVSGPNLSLPPEVVMAAALLASTSSSTEAGRGPARREEAWRQIGPLRLWSGGQG